MKANKILYLCSDDLQDSDFAIGLVGTDYMWRQYALTWTDSGCPGEEIRLNNLNTLSGDKLIKYIADTWELKIDRLPDTFRYPIDAMNMSRDKLEKRLYKFIKKNLNLFENSNVEASIQLLCIKCGFGSIDSIPYYDILIAIKNSLLDSCQDKILNWDKYKFDEVTTFFKGL